MVKINLTLELKEVEQIVAALTAQGTPEAEQLAHQITMVRRQHKVMFGMATQTHLRKDLLMPPAPPTTDSPQR
jgi:hypothetical protein